MALREMLYVEQYTVTAKQREFLKTPMSRINLLEGSVRSGKTWISIVAWALFVASMPQNGKYLMVGRTINALERNCLGLLKELEPSFTYSTNSKKGQLYGRTIWLEGADNDTAVTKIQGETLAGAYIDELANIPENFYKMVLSRLSVIGAKLFATTNPDSPSNYVYQDIIKNDKIKKKVTKFLIDDNTTLDPEYVAAIKTEYTGIFYQRYIRGEWVVAEGLVYPDFAKNIVKTVDRKYDTYYLGIDYGTQNPFAMLLVGHCIEDKRWYVIKDYYYSGRDTNKQKTDEEYYTDMCKLLGNIVPQHIIVDPSASSYIALIRKNGKYHVRKADNEVLDGIRHTASTLANGFLYVNNCCKDLIEESTLYSWDADASEDTVIKENDHALDSLRYIVQTARLYRQKQEYKGGFL